MGKLERKVRQTIKRSAQESAKELQLKVAQHRPWYIPRFIWKRVIGIILDSSIKSIKGEGR